MTYTIVPKEAKEAAARALCRHGASFPTIEQTLEYVDQKWPRFKEEAEIALTAALPHLPGVGVKKLEWRKYRNGDAEAVTPFGEIYTAYVNGYWRITRNGKAGKFIKATGGEDVDAAKAGAQADYSARILSALEPSAAPEPIGYLFQHEDTGLEQVVEVQQVEWGFEKNNPRWQKIGPVYSVPVSQPSVARELALEEGDLNARLKAKGMYSIDEMMGSLPLDKWRVHSGMTDLKFFGEWLERKAREYLIMKAAYDVGREDEGDDLYEWVLAHYGAFSDVLVNFRAALSSPDHPDAGKVEGDGWLPTHRHKKRGSTYQVIAEGRLQVDGDLDNERVVIYRGEDGQHWVRPAYEFNDGRFETLPSAPASEGAE
ncbi:hypothetical protein [Brucella intermedia]|uniref:hypothetical protein n=1 Tax=Brucella intermedia TaxID=94625 RepID=UPI00224B589F|nr:hypothetical protein [Brucella intermedia]